MWPWDHLAFAYLMYSGGLRFCDRSPVAELPMLCLVAGSQFPDIVDKPLWWTFSIVPVLTHSVVVALPLALCILLATRRIGQIASGIAFVTGYSSHLIGDLLYPLATDGVLGYQRLLWPLVEYAGEPEGGLVATAWRFFESYAFFLSTSDAFLYVLADFILICSAITLWLADGRPGLGTLRELYHRLGRVARTLWK